MRTLTDEIARRRTFAITSHPDAAKTTLTEKLPLFDREGRDPEKKGRVRITSSGAVLDSPFELRENHQRTHARQERESSAGANFHRPESLRR
ncbi:MAG TPA: hypothetical protein VKG22_07055 [Stellaceae bacterium]|nr:hypothetical protein [Stellaceae bacterium]